MRRYADGRTAHAMAALDSVADAVLSVDAAGRIIYLNRAAEDMTGWRFAAASGQPFENVCRVVGGDAGLPPTASTVRRLDRPAGTTNTIVIKTDGCKVSVERTVTPIFNGRGEANGAVIVLRDGGAALERALQALRRAEQDPLTGLPNRLVLHDRLTEAIGLAHRHHRALAVLYLDVDGFKAVNDAHGHAAGDRFLRAIAARLSDTLRQSDTVSRWGGDEFVVVLPEIEHAGHAAAVGRKLVRAVSHEGHGSSEAVRATASLGIALYPEHGCEGDTLIANADAAMYAAKRAGPGRARLFEASPAPPPAQDRMLVAPEPSAVRRAVRRDLAGAGRGRAFGTST